MRRALAGVVAALTLGACAGSLPEPTPMQVGERCAVGDLTVELEDGYSGASHCPTLAAFARIMEDEYDAHFGHQGPVTVRLRNTKDLQTDGDGQDFAPGWFVTGTTFEGGVIDIALGQLRALPHELNHVRTGAGHGGWCADFEPWSEQVLGINQREYLGCN